MLDLALPDLSPAALLSGFEQACVLQAQGKLPQARAAFEDLLRVAPEGHLVCAPAWSNLGLVLDDLGDADAARLACEQAIAQDPGLYAPHLYLGQWWMNRTEPDAPARAERCLQEAARLQPHLPGVWSSLGALLTCLRRDADAEACLRHALQLDATHDGARFNLAYLCLRQGRWAEGWACLEARATSKALSRQLPWTRWAGEPLVGRRLLIVNDAGHGDLIHFWRYRSRLQALGAGEVAWMVQPPLIPLLKGQPGVGPLWPLDGPLPGAAGPQDLDQAHARAPELWAPLMSLPWLCGDDGDWPADLPYLQAPASPHAIKPSARPFTIGLVWHGSARHENDAERSLPHVHSLLPVCQAAQRLGLRLVNLQPEDHLGPAAARASLQGTPMGMKAAALATEPGPPLLDFAQAASALQDIDLLITVDTAYAHLAGALGRPVWVMLPHWKTDWRWLEHRADSPWYPGVMRLFRQGHRGDWAGVIAEVAQALGELAPLAPQAPLDPIRPRAAA
jgi:tetratricopeptide (TPR) repeat protein